MRAIPPAWACASASRARGFLGSVFHLLRIGDQVPKFDVFWPKHLQEVRYTVNIQAQSM